MTPDPAEDPLADAREFVDRVEELVREGRPAEARRHFAREWRDAVPEHPVRFAARLRNINHRRLAEIAREISQGGDVPELVFNYEGEVIRIALAEDGEVIGQLRVAEAAILSETQTQLYTPQLLEIRTEEERVEEAIIAIARPAQRICTSCQEVHDGEFVNCEKCRAKRRRKGPEDESYETAPVSFHEAFEALVVEQYEREEDKD